MALFVETLRSNDEIPLRLVKSIPKVANGYLFPNGEFFNVRDNNQPDFFLRSLAAIEALRILSYLRGEGTHEAYKIEDHKPQEKFTKLTGAMEISTSTSDDKRTMMVSLSLHEENQPTKKQIECIRKFLESLKSNLQASKIFISLQIYKGNPIPDQTNLEYTDETVLQRLFGST
jgi:hypothetical protein